MLDDASTLHTERLMLLRDTLYDLTDEDPFFMGSWGYCISGWTVQLFGGEAGDGETLGLSQEVADSLFLDQPRATSKQAAQAVENVLIYGEPNWDLAMTVRQPPQRKGIWI